MFEWLDLGMRIVVSSVALMLVIKYGHRWRLTKWRCQI